MQEQPKRPLKLVVLLAIFAIFVFGFYWLWNSAFVQISVTNPTTGNYSYQFTDQKSGKIIEVKTHASSVKKRLARGNYSVLVKQDDKSYLSIISTGGFFKTSDVNAVLSKEKSRIFVGDNPGSCMSYINNVLVSYACTDLFENINIHQPANASQPTYVLKNPNPFGIIGYVQGIVQTSRENIALVKIPADSDADGGYSILSLGDNLKITNQRALSNLDLNTSYSISPYKDGFIIYSQTLIRAYYYSSLNAEPVSISLDNSNKDLTPSYLSVKDGLILTAFISGTDSNSKTAQTEIIINNEGRSNHYLFNKVLTSSVPCGNQLLCVVDSSGLSVYGLANKKPDLLYDIVGTSAVLDSPKGTLVITKDGVLKLDTTARSGFLEYSFGDYKFNDIRGSGGGYILSLTNPSGKKVAIYVDQAVEDTDQIDKKILQVQKLPEISNSSIYGQYIFISPNLGSLAYNNDTQSYDYDQSAKANANTKINQAIDKASINRSVYQIISTIK